MHGQHTTNNNTSKQDIRTTITFTRRDCQGLPHLHYQNTRTSHEESDMLRISEKDQESHVGELRTAVISQGTLMVRSLSPREAFVHYSCI